MSNILQEIFLDNYEEFMMATHPRQAVIENVDKMVECGNPSFGGAMYGCTKCGTLKFVPFRCHSRFCPTCGTLYSAKRTTAMSFKLVRTTHRHCVFTIPEELRHFFIEDRDLLNCLFSSVRSVILEMFHKDNKFECFTPGMICVLHTFGRSLQWNPHIHCLVTEGGVGNKTVWRAKKHFNYTYLRNAFRTALLNEMEEKIGPSFKKTKAYIYKHCANGFYVYAKPNQCNPNQIAKYIGRYLGRPVISTKRIDSYKNGIVTYHYNRHEDDKLVVVKLPAIEFMKLLAQHIPEKHFKQIRYYGIYARYREQDQKIFKAIPKEKHRFLLNKNKWRNSIASTFGYDPIQCPCCKETMSILEIKYAHHSYTLQELYERAWAKAG